MFSVTSFLTPARAKAAAQVGIAVAAFSLLAHTNSAGAQQIAMAGPALPQVNVTVVGGQDRAADSRGTAFLVDRDTWVTAAHVVKGCSAVYVRAGGEWRPANQVTVHGSADLAIFRARQDDRSRPLKLSERAPSMGDAAFHIGFAKGEFTSVDTKLSAQANVKLANTGGVSASFVWSQNENHGERRMNGISGGPQLDSRGAVQGVTISYGGSAGQPLRMTTVPMSELRGFLPTSVEYAAEDARTFQGRTADHAKQLRNNGSVTSVYCATTASARNLPRT